MSGRDFIRRSYKGSRNPNYGKKHKGLNAGNKNPMKRDDVKNKMVETRKRNKNYSAWNKGKKYLGKEKNPNWKGGITPLNKKIRYSFEYRLWIKFCMQRDNYTCQKCEIIGGNLEVHHLNPLSNIIKENNIKNLEDAQKCEKVWDLENGITLCQKCHSDLDKFRRNLKRKIR